MQIANTTRSGPEVLYNVAGDYLKATAHEYMAQQVVENCGIESKNERMTKMNRAKYQDPIICNLQRYMLTTPSSD